MLSQRLVARFQVVHTSCGPALGLQGFLRGTTCPCTWVQFQSSSPLQLSFSLPPACPARSLDDVVPTVGCGSSGPFVWYARDLPIVLHYVHTCRSVFANFLQLCPAWGSLSCPAPHVLAAFAAAERCNSRAVCGTPRYYLASELIVAWNTWLPFSTIRSTSLFGLPDASLASSTSHALSLRHVQARYMCHSLVVSLAACASCSLATDASSHFDRAHQRDVCPCSGGSVRVGANANVQTVPNFAPGDAGFDDQISEATYSCLVEKETCGPDALTTVVFDVTNLGLSAAACAAATALLRTFVLLQLLAFLRLLLVGAAVRGRNRGRRPLRSRWSRTIAGSLKGAPLALAICFCVPSVRAVATPGSAAWSSFVRHSDVDWCLLPDPWAAFSVEFVGPIRTLAGLVTLDVEGAIPVPEPPEPRLHTAMRFAAEVLHYQRSPSFSFHSTHTVSDLDDLVAEVLEQIDLDATGDILVAVVPQPFTDRPVFLAPPARTDVTFAVPVCVQVAVRGARPVYWLDFVGSLCPYSEVRDLAGSRFCPGMILRVGSDDTALFEGDSFTATRGMLLRFDFPGRRARAVAELPRLLRTPHASFADIEEEGTPESFAVDGSTCVLCRQALPELVNINRQATDEQALQIIASRIPVPSQGVQVVRPEAAIRDVFVRGNGAERSLAILPIDRRGLVGVFIDARDIAVTLKCVLLVQRRWLVSELLEAIGAHCHAPIRVVASNGSCATSVQGAISLTQNVVLTFSCHLYPGVGCPAGDDVISPGIASEIAGSGPSAKTTVPAASCSLGSGPALGWSSDAAPTTSQQCSVFATPSDWCCPAPVAPPLPLPAPLSYAAGGAYKRFCDGEEHVCALLYNEGPGANVPILAPASDSDDDSRGSADGSPMEDVGQHEETEWRILCAILSYQARPRYNTLFVGRDERLVDVLERAQILLLPPDGSLRLVLVDPSPLYFMLTFIVYPAWWSRAEFTAFLLSWSEDDLPPFVEIGRADSVLGDFFPDSSMQPESPHVNVFTNSSLRGMVADTPFQPQMGALVMTRPPSVPDPDVVYA